MLRNATIRSSIFSKETGSCMWSRSDSPKRMKIASMLAATACSIRSMMKMSAYRSSSTKKAWGVLTSSPLSSRTPVFLLHAFAGTNFARVLPFFLWNRSRSRYLRCFVRSDLSANRPSASCSATLRTAYNLPVCWAECCTKGLSNLQEQEVS